MSNRMAAIAASLFAVAVAGQAAFAAPVYWTNSSGSTSKVAYSNGQSDNGLFGDPTLTGGTFQFVAPQNFSSQASGGSADTTQDRVSFTVTTTTGDMASINLSEFGNWSILGGTGLTKTKVTTGLTITRLDPGHFGVVYQINPTVKYTDLETGNVYTSPTIPTSEGSGNWRADYVYSLPTGTKTVAVALENFLQTTSEAGSTSQLAKTAVSITAVTAAVPEPASLAVLALGGGAVLARRRRA